MNDIFFPSGYYAALFHDQAARVSSAIQARQVAGAHTSALSTVQGLERRFNLTMDLLKALGERDKGAIEMATEGARSMNLAMEMHAAMSASALMNEHTKAEAAVRAMQQEAERREQAVKTGSERDAKAREQLRAELEQSRLSVT